MGPILIFDKSVLESLNSYEAMWLDQFYLSNITPLFFIETLADLEKEVKAGRTQEDVVGWLANKTPEMGRPNIHHTTLLEAELFGGHEIDMQLGRLHVSGGRPVELAGKTGVIFQSSPEEEAFSRWREHKFMELERSRAKAWRRGLSNIDFEQHYKYFQTWFPLGKPRTLAGVKQIVDSYIDGSDRDSVLRFGLSLIGLAERATSEVVSRWNQLGKPPLREFAPYFAHVMSVDLVFYLGIAADLIGRGRPSHKVDVAYLYYLPFCMVFSSNDKLHSNIVPLFLRGNQTYVLGSELKSDLANLEKHYDAFPEDIKKRGLSTFAMYPPRDRAFLVARLWDKHMRPTWREDQTLPSPLPGSENSKRIMEEIRKVMEDGKPIPDERRTNFGEPDQMVIERKVRARIGKWNRFPPEVINRRKNEKGEWESAYPN